MDESGCIHTSPARLRKAVEASKKQGRYLMFGSYTLFGLRRAFEDVRSKKLRDGYLIDDAEAVEELESNRASGSQVHFLNRYDLLGILYAELKDEIDRIDRTPFNDLALLISVEWSHPEVMRRLMWRLENNI
jgi:hypothetical protein